MNSYFFVFYFSLMLLTHNKIEKASSTVATTVIHCRPIINLSNQNRVKKLGYYL